MRVLAIFLRTLILFAIFALLPAKGASQDEYRVGLLPVFNLNTKLERGFGLNGKLENRHIFRHGFIRGETVDANYQFERQDIEVNLSKKLLANVKVASGYLIRFEGERIISRVMQQFSLSKPLGRIRSAHRLKADQTWDPAEPFEFRLRYRIGFEGPLPGVLVDPKKVYFKSNFEYLARFQEGLVNEFRAIPALGYLTDGKNSFELGMDYRWGSIGEASMTHDFWIYVGYYLRLG